MCHSEINAAYEAEKILSALQMSIFKRKKDFYG